MKKGLISSLCTLGILFVLTLGNNSPIYSKTSDHMLEGQPGQVDAFGIDKTGSSAGVMNTDKDRSPGFVFDSYGLMGAWRSTY